jgi:hypothetical protein
MGENASSRVADPAAAVVVTADDAAARTRPAPRAQLITDEGIYEASPVKPRRRATAVEMDERARFLIDYANEHGPITVRGLYYQAEVASIPGIDKTDNAYGRVQRQVLSLRRAGRLAYERIADATRWMRKPRSYSFLQDALESTAAFYRRNLWIDAPTYLEIWCEKDALAGTIYPVTSKFDVPLMVTRGFCSETFAFEAIDQRGDDLRPYHVAYLGDFDRAGRDAALSLKRKLQQFGEAKGIDVVFTDLAVTLEQIDELGLPTRAPKRVSAADKAWPHPIACELDAIPPDYLRGLVQDEIERHLPADQYRVLKIAEQSEREQLWRWAEGCAA